ncbi:stage III sporulation protein AA [Rubeoparvulum massiliense]|uniref:stage III sporulation protein AA n=1 Tax=Rubeoparvulum massiliense TaxID=1631346 RepID=UPI00065E5E9A|nr:stage III sporulation protein AA [Rubeoparvulum massiliense]
MLQKVIAVLPPHLQALLHQLPTSVLDQLEEIRVRQGRPLELITSGDSHFVSVAGSFTGSVAAAYEVTAEDCQLLLNMVSNYSLYALEEELQRGYITIPGGHRVGIVGRALLEGGRLSSMKEIASFNIRVAREHQGIATSIVPTLFQGNQLLNTLIISPPQCGKTTLLRDLARCLSSTVLPPRKVSIVDERSEIAAVVDGIPQHNVGPRTDVLDGCPKAEGMMLLIRSMSPHVIIVDEIGRAEDVVALEEALHAGIAIITTVHGTDIKDLTKRPTFTRILSQQMFQRYIILSRRQGVGTIEKILDEEFIEIGCSKR